MCCNWKALLLPALILVLAGGALVVQNLPSVAADVPTTAAVQPTDTTTADAGTPVTVGTWQETGNVRGKPGGTVHIVQP